MQTKYIRQTFDLYWALNRYIRTWFKYFINEYLFNGNIINSKILIYASLQYWILYKITPWNKIKYLFIPQSCAISIKLKNV